MSTLTGDTYVSGTLSAKQMLLPAGCVTDTAIVGGVSASKIVHQHRKQLAQTKTSGAAVTERRVIHVVRGTTGTLLEVVAGIVTAAVGAATVTLDLYKNGVTMLSSVITLDNSHTAYQNVTASLSTTALVAGDVLELVIVATAGGGTLPQGLFAEVSLEEDYA